MVESWEYDIPKTANKRLNNKDFFIYSIGFDNLFNEGGNQNQMKKLVCVSGTTIDVVALHSLFTFEVPDLKILSFSKFDCFFKMVAFECV